MILIDRYAILISHAVKKYILDLSKGKGWGLQYKSINLT